MAQRRPRVVKHYARTRESHNLANAFAHICAVAVRLALRAEALLFHLRAGKCAAVGIFGQGTTLDTQLPAAVNLTAIECYHIGHDTALVLGFA